MDVRVWGVVGERLVEVGATEGAPGTGLSIEGLAPDRCRTVADRVRAALVVSGLVLELPPTTIRLSPSIRGGSTAQLDLPIALGVLGRAGRFAGVRWVFASGRLGLDGRVFAENLEKSLSIVTVVTELGWRDA